MAGSANLADNGTTDATNASSSQPPPLLHHVLPWTEHTGAIVAVALTMLSVAAALVLLFCVREACMRKAGGKMRSPLVGGRAAKKAANGEGGKR